MTLSPGEVEELRELVLNQHDELRNLRREISDLNMLMAALHTLLESDAQAEPFTAVFTALQPLFHFSHAIVLVDNQLPGQLRCMVSSVAPLAESLWARDPLLNKALRGRVIATISRPPDTYWPTEVTRRGLSAEQPTLYIPLRFRQHRGVLMLLRARDAAGFDRRDVTVARKLSLLASQALATRHANDAETERINLLRLAKDLRVARDSLSYRANHDPLTGLVNRSYFDDEVRRVIRAAEPGVRMAVAFVDIDGFKQVNDSYGHEIGDQLLVATTRRLQAHARPGDEMARVAGDEFIALMADVGDDGALYRRLDRIMTDLQRPHDIGGRRVVVSTSAGLAVFPDHGVTYDELRRHADMATLEAKESARGTVVVFNDAIGEKAAQQQAHEQEVRRAVADRRFRAVVQPKISLPDLQIVGFEVLARMVGEDGSLGSSAAFIPVAEQVGLLDTVTDMIIADVVGAIPVLDAAFGNHTTFSVNISTAQITNPLKLQTVLDQIAAADQRDRFILEVTEDALLASEIFQEQIVPLVADAGLSLSIDDFGTGFASMSRLLTVTADEIKIDRSFITDLPQRPRSQVMLKAMETIGAELGSTVVAEGIETLAELQYLMNYTKVHLVQGFLFARPGLPHDLAAVQPSLCAELSHMAASCKTSSAVSP